jgi:glycosyltransferase involved in cell wall biosynthesis
MRVALDATPLTLSSGGLARYTRELSQALAAQYPEDEYVLLSDQLPPWPRNAWERRWWLWGVDREMNRRRCDLFHGTNFSVPYLPRRPSVLTLHDLSPWMNQDWHHAAARIRQRTPLLIGLGIATLIITPTEAIRDQAIETFSIHPGRIVTIPEAASAHFRPSASSPSRPYFLFAGTLEPRKNLPLLISAWRSAKEQFPVDLVLAGRRRADFPEPPPEPGLRLPGEIPERDLPALYSGALAFVYPSLYEGFGLPVLEAMQCGAPVITSRDAALTEVARGAALQVDSCDVRAWAEALRMAASSPERMRMLREKSLQRAQEFSWARTACRTKEVYQEARRRFESA